MKPSSCGCIQTYPKTPQTKGLLFLHFYADPFLTGNICFNVSLCVVLWEKCSLLYERFPVSGSFLVWCFKVLNSIKKVCALAEMMMTWSLEGK